MPIALRRCANTNVSPAGPHTGADRGGPQMLLPSWRSLNRDHDRMLLSLAAMKREPSDDRGVYACTTFSKAPQNWCRIAAGKVDGTQKANAARMFMVEAENIRAGPP